MKMELCEASSSLPESSLFLPETTEGHKKARTRLCGAARTRLRILLSKGIPKVEALKLAKMPMREMPIEIRKGFVKDQRAKETPMREMPIEIRKGFVKDQRAKETRPVNKAPTPKVENNMERSDSKVSCWKIGIFNKSPMTQEEMHLVHRNLIAQLVKAPKSSEPHQFDGVSYNEGWMLIICRNMTSRDWLKAEVRELKPWTGAELSTLDEAEPDLVLASCLIPSSEYISEENTIDLLKAQNVDLRSKIWKPVSSRAVEQGQYLTFAIEADAVKVLRKIDFMPNLGFGRKRVWITPASSNDGESTEQKCIKGRQIDVKQPMELHTPKIERCDSVQSNSDPSGMFTRRSRHSEQATEFNYYPETTSKEASTSNGYNQCIYPTKVYAHITKNMPILSRRQPRTICNQPVLFNKSWRSMKK